MSFPGSPKLLKAGIVLLDPENARVERVITMQYNPDTLNRTLQAQNVGGEGDRLETLRLKGPPIETIKLDADIDATDQLEHPRENPSVLDSGIAPQLAVLEMLVYPTSESLKEADRLAGQGVIEVAPTQTPLTLFIWSRSRIVPVRITEFTITEESFDTRLNPTRARVSLGMRVLSVNDFPFSSKGGSLYMLYQQSKEKLAQNLSDGQLSTLGIDQSLL